MTNHWTRFFPLLKYLRQEFLSFQHASVLNETIKDINHQGGKYNLGKVLAMHGDFRYESHMVILF